MSIKVYNHIRYISPDYRFDNNELYWSSSVVNNQVKVINFNTGEITLSDKQEEHKYRSIRRIQYSHGITTDPWIDDNILL